jgi:hypothetical protein
METGTKKLLRCASAADTGCSIPGLPNQLTAYNLPGTFAIAAEQGQSRREIKA